MRAERDADDGMDGQCWRGTDGRKAHEHALAAALDAEKAGRRASWDGQADEQHGRGAGWGAGVARPADGWRRGGAGRDGRGRGQDGGGGGGYGTAG